MKHISVALNTEQLKSITKQARDNGEADYRFDLNLMEGKLSENKWAEVLETVEFKKDYKAWQTGNIAVEYAFNDKPSGIAKTEAKYVAYVLVDEQQNENIAFFVKTNIIKDMCRKYYNDPKRNIKGGDNNGSSLILLPVDELVNPQFIFGIEKNEADVEYGDIPKNKLIWTFGCINCNYQYVSDSKNLFMTCPVCREKGETIKMEII